MHLLANLIENTPGDLAQGTTWGQVALLVTFLVTQYMQWKREKRNRQWQLEDDARKEAALTVEIRKSRDVVKKALSQQLDELDIAFKDVLPVAADERLDRIKHEVANKKDLPIQTDVRRECYTRMVELIHTGIRGFYTIHPEWAHDERAEANTEFHLRCAKQILELLDQYNLCALPTPASTPNIPINGGK